MKSQYAMMMLTVLGETLISNYAYPNRTKSIAVVARRLKMIQVFVTPFQQKREEKRRKR